MKTWMFIFFLVLALAEALTSCRARQSVIKERTIYDTAWTEKARQSQRNDSVATKEYICITPHIIQTGDTTIIYSDTVYYFSTERNHYITDNTVSNSGKNHVDTAYIEVSRPKPQPPTNNKADLQYSVRNRIKMAALTAALAIVISLLIRYRKQIVDFIRRLAKRHS